MNEIEWLSSQDPQAMFDAFLPSRPTLHPHGGRGHLPLPRPSDRKLRLFAVACCRQIWYLLTDERSRRAIEVAEAYANGLATEGDLAAARAVAWDAGEDIAWGTAWDANRGAALDVVRAIARSVIRYTVSDIAKNAAKRVQADLLRCIFGNPFREVSFDSDVAGPLGKVGFPSILFDRAWLRRHDGLIPRLAQAAYDQRGRRCPRCKGKRHIDRRISDDGIGRSTITEDCPDCGGSGRIEDGLLDPERLLVLADALEEAGCDNEFMLMHLRGYKDLGKSYSRSTAYPEMHVRGCWAVDFCLGKE